MAIGVIFSLSPWGSAAAALAFGVFVAIVFGNPYQDRTKTYSQKLLSYSIVGLGAGMNLLTVAQAGLSHFFSPVFGTGLSGVNPAPPGLLSRKI